MYGLFFLSLVLSIFSVLSFSTDWNDIFDHTTYIDEDQLFKLYWTNLENDIIEFGIEVLSIGWIALGISPRGQMPNSDIALGWVDNDGIVYLQDRYTIERSTPLYDLNQNLTLIEGEEVNGMTRLRFTRPKYSCDPDDMSLSKGTTRLIWAFHATQDPSEECFDIESAGSILFHTNKGSQSINLDSGVPEEIELEDDVIYIDFVMNNTNVPSDDTTYYCKLFKIPYFNNTHHIIKFETIVEEGHEALIHHLSVYDCPEYLATQQHEVTEDSCDDYSTNMPSRACRGTFLYNWAIGGNDIYLPDFVGMPISGDSDTHYILLEIHYDNPEEKSGIIDNSGFRMYITPSLRDIEAGFMQIAIGINPMGQWIPPGLSYAHHAAFMTSECSENIIPKDGIFIFGSMLHQHTIGIALNLRHIRNGKELAPIDTNLDYDFNYQQTIIFDQHIKILPGDEFILDCYTDSTERNFTTIGGESTRHEMCIGFLWYYPKIEFTSVGTYKTELAFSTWMKDAQTAGYMNGISSDIDNIFNNIDTRNNIDFSSLSYNTSIDGALEFYNRLYSVDYPQYNKNNLNCGDYFYTNISRNESFEKYDLGINDCENIINEDNIIIGTCQPSNIQNENGSVMIEIVLGFMFIIIILISY